MKPSSPPPSVLTGIGIFRLRSAYDGREAEISDANGLSCPEPTLAQQQFKDDCNLNSIMERYLRTGELSHFHDSSALYGDFTQFPDYHQSLNTVIAAQRTFDALPAKIRARFENDPAQFLAFCSDDKNLSELDSLGLLSKEASSRLQKSAVEEASSSGATSAPDQKKPPKKPISEASGGSSGGD